MKKHIKILLGGLLCPYFGIAQVVDGAVGYYNDALLFGQSSYTMGSTARMQALGGAQISLGADMSSAGSNPAGLGFLNRSVISFTPSLNAHNSDATYLGTTNSTYRNNFNFANLGLVFNTSKGDFTSEKFKGGSFAISLGRTNDFNNEIFYQGNNTNSSIIDSYIGEAGTMNPNNLGEYAFAAYENYLINPEYENDEIVGYWSDVRGFPRQTENIRRNGAQYDLNFAWGGNYDDKVYFGAGLTFATLNYSTRRVYTEDSFMYENEGNSVPEDRFSNLRITDKLSVNGSGVNALFGMIVRPIDMVTLGISYKTPTYYSLDEEVEFRNDVRWNNFQYDDETILNERQYLSDIYRAQYNLKSPSKVTFGGTVFLGKVGFLSAEGEMCNYGDAQLKSSDFDISADNQTVRNLYGSAFNYRAGAEFRLDHFRFRGGYAFYGDPNRTPGGFDRSRTNITGGVGFRNQDFFLDVTVVKSYSQEQYAPYFHGDLTPTATLDFSTTTILSTIGFNF